METKTPMLGCVADVKELPYPKGVIKKSIIRALEVSKDTRFNATLKVGYIDLASWQEGVGSEHQGLDLTKMDLNQSTSDLANAVLEQGKSFDKWKSIIQNEEKQLLKELQSLQL